MVHDWPNTSRAKSINNLKNGGRENRNEERKRKRKRKYIKKKQ
jgi:hypothetical protein